MQDRLDRTIAATHAATQAAKVNVQSRVMGNRFRRLSTAVIAQNRVRQTSEVMESEAVTNPGDASAVEPPDDNNTWGRVSVVGSAAPLGAWRRERHWWN